MRPLFVAVLALAIFGALAAYERFVDTLPERSHATEEAPPAAGKFSLELTLSFDAATDDFALENEPAVVVRMAGRDLIREIRHGLGIGYEQLPILVTTATNFDADPHGLNRIFSAGANDIIEKPLKESLLVARIHTLLNLRQHYLKLNPGQRLRAAAP